jgi:hypothetical protein
MDGKIMNSEELKKYFVDYQHALQNCNGETINGSLNKYFSNNSLIHFCHPFGTFNGLDNLLSKCLLPLIESIPDLERRDMIVMAGTTPEEKIG